MISDSVYTESYMGLPTENDNLDGYKQAQLIDKLENITSNSYFLIHGTFDDNVHYQHSLLLANELQKKDILFRQQVLFIDSNFYFKLKNNFKFLYFEH